MAENDRKKCIMIERSLRPKMLKEFLLETNHLITSRSSSSSGFKSFPRQLPDPTVKTLLDQAAASANTTLPRSRSRSQVAVEAAVTSFQKLLNVVKFLHTSNNNSNKFSSSMSLSRSISKRLLPRSWSGKKKMSKAEKESMMNKVKVKDILRWKSFRDLEGPSKPYGFVDCEYDDVVHQEDPGVLPSATTCTPTQSNGSSSSKGSGSESRSMTGSGSGSSWGGSEFSFTVDELPCWWGNSNSNEEERKEEWNKNNDVGATKSDVGPSKEDNQSMASEEDKEQHSPISVLDSPFREELSDEEYVSSFDQSLANVERTKQRLLESIQWFESLAGVSEDHDDETLEDEAKEKEQFRIEGKVFLSKTFKGLKGEAHTFEDKKECIKDIEKLGQWRQYEEEKGELGVELEAEVLSDLMDEVLGDLFGSSTVYLDDQI